MKRMVLAVFMATLVLPPMAGAQGKTNFSGTWRMDMARSESTAFGVSVEPVTLVIKQTATELSIETQRGDRSQTAIHKLDGSESTNAGMPDATGAAKSRSRWDGAKLVTQTVHDIKGWAVETTEVRSLDASGKEMTVETSLRVQHGYEGSLPAAQAYGAVKDVFTKTTP